MYKSSLKHVGQFFLSSIEKASISYTNVEFGFFFLMITSPPFLNTSVSNQRLSEILDG